MFRRQRQILVNLARMYRIGLLTPKDMVERLALRMMEKSCLRHPAEYMSEVAAYTRVSAIEAIKIARTGKAEHKARWHEKERKTEEEIRRFYQEGDWYVFRFPWKYRNSTWHFIPGLCRSGDKILEYGCGTACMTRWLCRHYDYLSYTVADIPSSTWNFVKWRFRDVPKVRFAEVGMGKEGLPLGDEKYDLITCLDVLEHAVNPMEIMEHLWCHLNIGGCLLINFVNDPGGENLEQSIHQRERIIEFLYERASVLIGMTEDSRSQGVYYKKWED